MVLPPSTEPASFIGISANVYFVVTVRVNPSGVVLVSTLAGMVFSSVL